MRLSAIGEREQALVLANTVAELCDGYDAPIHHPALRSFFEAFDDGRYRTRSVN